MLINFCYAAVRKVVNIFNIMACSTPIDKADPPYHSLYEPDLLAREKFWEAASEVEKKRGSKTPRVEH